MCIVQQVPTSFEVFGQLSDYILKRITSNPSTNIFFTTDQYWDASIKLCERSRRANSGLIRITNCIKKRPEVTKTVKEIPRCRRKQTRTNRISLS